MSCLRIATRGSELALWQARHVADRIERELGHETELVVRKTTGDRLTGSLAKVGGKGLFVKEIEEALRDEQADLAVHSAKDLPAEIDAALPIVGVPPREDPRDALCGRADGATLASLPAGARVGTGSVRRTAQLRAFRDDLRVVPLRGNVPTRLAKLESQGLDAVVLACAGLARLGRAAAISERIAVEQLLPAVAQGTLAIQARRGSAAADAAAALGDADTTRCFDAERAFLSRLGGDCSVPIAALAECLGDARIRLRALVIAPDGTERATADLTVAAADAARAGREAAVQILASGGAALLERAREEAL